MSVRTIPAFGLMVLVCNLFSTTVMAGQKALVMIDMQDIFATYYHYDKKGNNPAILKQLREKQKRIIRAAEDNLVPILIVETTVAAYTPTNQELLEAIGDYPVTTFFKNVDAMFDSDEGPYIPGKNISKDAIKEELQRLGVTDLIVIGINGRFCVYKSIVGALAEGYTVWAYTGGIADFADESFIYPFKYSEQSDGLKITHERFHETDNIAEIFRTTQKK